MLFEKANLRLQRRAFTAPLHSHGDAVARGLTDTVVVGNPHPPFFSQRLEIALLHHQWSNLHTKKHNPGDEECRLCGHSHHRYLFQDGFYYSS